MCARAESPTARFHQENCDREYCHPFSKWLDFDMHPSAWVYILTNDPRHTTLYVGSSNDLPTRLWEHRTKRKPGCFTARYNVFKPVYYEPFDDINDAVKREWFIKGKTRKWKEALIATMNPEWMDLTEEIMRKYS